jgi:Na+/phosphate symporter
VSAEGLRGESRPGESLASAPARDASTAAPAEQIAPLASAEPGPAVAPPTRGPAPGAAEFAGGPGGLGMRRAGVHAWRGAGLVAALLGALALFALSLRLLSAAAGGVASAFDTLAVEGALNTLGVGWLFAYGALSGSPVAALALSLFDGGAISDAEAVAMLSGSRLGASLIVLLVGFVAYARRQHRPDGIYVGVVALLTTFVVFLPATPLALALLQAGVLDGVGGAGPLAGADSLGSPTDPLIELVDGLPGVLLFAGGVGSLLAAFWLFDRVLPSLDPPSPRVERLSRRLSRPHAMFLLGALITALTLSVAISVTILVPLALKGVVSRRAVIPYVMGANITTFVDTFAAALLLRSDAGVSVVLVAVLAVSLVSALVLLLYRPASRALLATAHTITQRPRWLASFLVVSAAVPLLLAAL